MTFSYRCPFSGCSTHALYAEALCRHTLLAVYIDFHISLEHEAPLQRINRYVQPEFKSLPIDTSMASKFQPFAFNGQVDMTAAMGWSYDEVRIIYILCPARQLLNSRNRDLQITRFLDDLWDKPDKYNVEQRSRRDLGTAVTNIKALA